MLLLLARAPPALADDGRHLRGLVVAPRTHPCGADRRGHARGAAGRGRRLQLEDPNHTVDVRGAGCVGHGVGRAAVSSPRYPVLELEGVVE